MEDQACMTGFLREFVRDRDVPCPTCKYNLRDLASTVCPECGEAPILRLQAENPRVAVLVLGLLPLAMTLGFFAIVTLFVVAVSIIEGDWPPLMYWVAAPALGVVYGLLTAGWIRGWTRIRRWSQAKRVASIIGCWIAMIVGSGAFLMAVMTL